MNTKERSSITIRDLEQIVTEYRPIKNAPRGILEPGMVRRTFYTDVLKYLLENKNEQIFKH